MRNQQDPGDLPLQGIKNFSRFSGSIRIHEGVNLATDEYPDDVPGENLTKTRPRDEIGNVFPTLGRGVQQPPIHGHLEILAHDEAGEGSTVTGER